MPASFSSSTRRRATVADENNPSNLYNELSRLRLSTSLETCDWLDQYYSAANQADREALSLATVQHDRVRESAEIVRAKFELQLELDRQRKVEEDRRELDRIRHEKVEKELAEQRRAIAELQAAEAERRKVEAARAEVEERRRKEALEKERAVSEASEAKAKQARVAKEEADRKQQESAAAAEEVRRKAAAAAEARKAEPASQPVAKPVAQPQGQPATSAALQVPQELRTLHEKYLALHQHLKVFRRHMLEEAKKHPALKKNLGEMRRQIRKSVGQLTEGRGANKTPTSALMNILHTALADTTLPHVPLSQFLVRTTPALEAATVPPLFVYLLSHFAKAILSQFLNEAGVSPKTADPIGIVCVSIFATPAFCPSDQTLIDILRCKYHKLAPVLFGMNGSQADQAGKLALGYVVEDEMMISDQRHAERQTGLGAGYASISLRNFTKSKSNNPFPNYHYWNSLANIINLPKGQVARTHYVLLKAMIEGYESRFLEFYGRAALVALRKALVDFPQNGDGDVAASALAVLPDVLKRDKRLTL